MAFELGEWAEPNGQDCPVDQRLVVDIERRDGTTNRGPAGYWFSPYRHQNSWYHNGGSCDIVRYSSVYFNS